MRFSLEERIIRSLPYNSNLGWHFLFIGISFKHVISVISVIFTFHTFVFLFLHSYNNLYAVTRLPLLYINWLCLNDHCLACNGRRFSSLFAAEGRFARRNVGDSAAEIPYTDDVNQCLHNKAGRHGVPNANLFKFTFLLVDFGKVLCSSANELHSHIVIDSSRLHLTFAAFCLLSVIRKQWLK